MLRNKKELGFSLIELLVIIAIIGLLSSVAMLMLKQQSDRTKQTKEDADLKQLATAIQALEVDTGKWPGGCPPRQVATATNQLYLDTAAAGINTPPVAGATGSDPNCVWTTSDVANWKGPYINQTSIQDPWHISYVFDPMYCDDSGATRIAILSLGKNMVVNYRNATCPNLVANPLGTDDEVRYLY